MRSSQDGTSFIDMMKMNEKLPNGYLRKIGVTNYWIALNLKDDWRIYQDLFRTWPLYLNRVEKDVSQVLQVDLARPTITVWTFCLMLVVK